MSTSTIASPVIESRPGSWSALRAIQKNQVFRFLSSVRMAVPLMLVILVAVAIGTLYESRYNAQIASLKVYRTYWFQGLMCLLWVNIFCAAVSRIPYKLHQTGFVITHIGLLTLLMGAWITMEYGIDGQLRVLESQSGNVVVLSEPVIKVVRPDSQGTLTYRLGRSMDIRTGEQLGLSDLSRQTGIRVARYLPFVMPGKGYSTDGAPALAQQGSPAAAAGGVTVNFNLQSAFFNVNDSLNSAAKPETQMGPARIRLVSDASSESNAHQIPSHSEPAPPIPNPAKKRNPHAPGPASAGIAAPAGGTLTVKDARTGAELGKLGLSELTHKPRKLGGVEVSLVKAYEEGVVAQNKLAEGGHPGKNPALELRVSSGSRSVREVAFANFPGFALNEGGALGLRFVYQPSGSGSGAEPQAEAPVAAAADPGGSEPAGDAAPADRSGNVIEFHTLGADSSKVRLELYKNGQSVLKQTVPVGQTVQTPWMGMKITVSSVSSGGGGAAADSVGRATALSGGSDQVTPIELQPKSPLPPSAVYVDLEDGGASAGGWIIEGDSRVIQTKTGPYEVYYGPDLVNLPFSLKLDKFEKVDYPGTETAMSFQSTIRVNGSGPPILISMNEPLKYEGYLLYQSSYEMGQGQPTASIFSVNRDPGRQIKYLGAVILIAGIAIFTVMRSKPFLSYQKRKAALA